MLSWWNYAFVWLLKWWDGDNTYFCDWLENVWLCSLNASQHLWQSWQPWCLWHPLNFIWNVQNSKKMVHKGTTETNKFLFTGMKKWYMRLQILWFSTRITSERTDKNLFIRRQCYSGWSCSSIVPWMINSNFIGYYITDLIKDGTFPNTFMIFGGLVWVLSSYVMSKITCLDARVITEGTSKRFLPSVPHEVPFQWLPTRSSKVTFITF